jgi:hypothetical protein
VFFMSIAFNIPQKNIKESPKLENWTCIFHWGAIMEIWNYHLILSLRKHVVSEHEVKC